MLENRHRIEIDRDGIGIHNKIGFIIKEEKTTEKMGSVTAAGIEYKAGCDWSAGWHYDSLDSWECSEGLEAVRFQQHEGIFTYVSILVGFALRGQGCVRRFKFTDSSSIQMCKCVIEFLQQTSSQLLQVRNLKNNNVA